MSHFIHFFKMLTSVHWIHVQKGPPEIELKDQKEIFLNIMKLKKN